MPFSIYEFRANSNVKAIFYLGVKDVVPLFSEFYVQFE
jgi:hypothetical protein